MKLIICVLSVLVTGCMTSIINEYKYLQQDGNFTELDMLQCQLRAHGNTNVCAVRVNTTTTNGIVHDTEERVICELLSLAWCYSPVFESGYTYSGKKTVSHTPPYTFYYYAAPNSWEIWETIPIAILHGVEIGIVFTAPIGPWVEIRMNLRNAAEAVVTYKRLWPDDIPSGVRSTIVATFATSQVNLEIVGGQTHTLPPAATGSIADIRILNLVFYGMQGEIHLVSYRAAPW